MKLIIPFLFCLFLGAIVNAQIVKSTKRTSEHSTYVKGNNFEGVIFSEEYQMPYVDNPTSEFRFTPSIEEIELAEKILKEQLPNINKGLNQGKNLGPNINKKLSKYQRQYIGFITEDGERHIYISCNRQRYNLMDRIRGYSPPDDSWKTEFWIVFDGGSNHWNIKVNLDKKELLDLNVNGVA